MSKSGATWNFTYDADGLRTKRTDGANTYLYYYDGGLLRCMEYNGVKMFFTYDAQGMPVSMTYNGATYYYALNLQGDVMALLDSSGNWVVKYTYDAWGNILTTTASTEAMRLTLAKYNPLRYRGYVYDRETGRYYLQSRYSNPEICRFINADAYISTGQGFTGHNMFAYCGNNPICRSACSGERYVVEYIYTSEGENRGKYFLYYTSIIYHEEKRNFWGRYRKTGNSIATVFSYKIYSDGIIFYDNNQSGTYFLESSDIRFPLAWEMYYAALGQVPGSMKYRTVEGISKELQLHYKCFKWHIPFIYDNAEFAEMGSVNKKGETGHDGNSWIFEVISWFC